jgi:hypothetical protein
MNISLRKIWYISVNFWVYTKNLDFFNELANLVKLISKDMPWKVYFHIIIYESIQTLIKLEHLLESSMQNIDQIKSECNTNTADFP